MIRRIIASASLWLALAAPAGAATPALQVRGNALVDTASASASAFVPRGVNWPSFEYACHHGYGYANAHSDADAAAIARWHVNTVRLPLNQDCWLGDDAEPRFGTAAGYRRAVRDWVATLHRHGLAVVLDLHWSGPDGAPAGGQRAMPDDRSVAFWRSVAATFARDRAVLFDVFNEPYSRWEGDRLAFDLTWACWRDGRCPVPLPDQDHPLDGRAYPAAGMRDLVAAIRAAGARQPIILSGRDYANDLSGWLEHRPHDDQLVAGLHAYRGQRCDTRACWDAEVAPVAAQVPVLITETGQEDCRADHVRAAMDWADRHGAGYLLWEWVLPDGAARCGDVSALSLIADARGTPRAPVGTELARRLADPLGARPWWLTPPRDPVA